MQLILNHNSLRGTSHYADIFAKVLHKKGEVFVTKSIKDLEKVVDKIDSDIIALAGGDGTVISFLQLYHGDAKIFHIPLGTGNALAYHTGFSRPVSDLEMVLKGEYAFKKLPLLDIDGSPGYIFSIGNDAAVVNLAQKRKVPSYLWQTLKQFIKMINLTKNPYHNRQSATVLTDSKNFYDFACNTVAIGTIPFYCYGWRAFPWAKDGKAHVKLFNQGCLRFLINARKIWYGKLNNTDVSYPYMMDFTAKSIEIRFDKPQYAQNTGEPLGKLKNVRIKVARSVDLIVKKF